jgi:hypothetical protein
MIRIIATFIFIYLIFRIFVGWILPALVRWYVSSYRKRFYRDNPQAKQTSQKKKGNVNISYSENPEGSATDRIGEYVDFEDLKENSKTKN